MILDEAEDKLIAAYHALTENKTVIMIAHRLRTILFRSFDGNLKTNDRTAPEDLKPEKCKNPSAKRLAKRVSKKKKKLVIHLQNPHITAGKGALKLRLINRFFNSPFFITGNV